VDIASVRILRLAFGTGISLFVSQVANWEMSFVAPIITMVVLGLPLPAPRFSAGVKFSLVFMIAVSSSLVLLPVIIHYPAAGLLLAALLLFLIFLDTARGGSAIVGTFATFGITFATAIGTVSIDVLLSLIGALGIGVVVGILFVWVGHALVPDSLAPAVETAKKTAPPAATKPDEAQAIRAAFRSLLIVLPILVWFLLSSASASYVVVMIKVAAMGQQALSQTRGTGRSLLASTVIGGIAAILAWQLLSIHSSLLLYCLLVVLAGLIFGPRIFKGPGMQAAAGTWSYAYLTMLIILAPAVLDQQSGSSAGGAFWSRLIMLYVIRGDDLRSPGRVRI